MPMAIETKEVGTGYENTAANIDALDREPRIRFKLTQTMKGVRWSEFTLRVESVDEMEPLSKDVIKKLREIEAFANAEV